MKIGLVVPHIFMQEALLGDVIFSPGQLALNLADGLVALGHDVTLYTPGPVTTAARNQTADLSYFRDELQLRGYGYIELLKKHPLTFISLARQVQSELVATAFNADVDIVHIYTNEEDVALPFIRYCQKPVVLTHHDPFNFSTQYRTVFPKYKHLNWLSISYAQRRDMPTDTNWLANIYHGLRADRFQLNDAPQGNYVAFCGRIVEAKGVHLAIAAVRSYNRRHPSEPLKLKLAGKHYAGGAKDDYWQSKILPELDDTVSYEGFMKTDAELQDFLGNARALLMPSTFNEPFGLVMAEALACGTPVIGLPNGAIPEVVEDGVSGFVTEDLVSALEKIPQLSRHDCRHAYESRFTLERMCREHAEAYAELIR